MKSIVTRFFRLVLFLTLLVFILYFKLNAQVAKDFSVMCTASSQSNPTPKITLKWSPVQYANKYYVYKKLITGSSWGNALATLDSNVYTWADATVEVGKVYEYMITTKSDKTVKLAGQNDVTIGAVGYIVAAVEAEQPSMGKVLLLVDNSIATPLATEITRLIDDLVSEGWTVVRQDVPRTETFSSNDVKTVKDIIVNEYQSDSKNLTTVFILGRVAVPYSGQINPDGHPDHIGAWPSDVYYSITKYATWTDATVNSTAATREENKNIPGDGKFDASSIPATVNLQLGRVDLYNMPAFTTTEVELLRKYLNKNHDYRTGTTKYKMRGLVDDNFPPANFGYQEVFASCGWRNFGSFFGGDSVREVDWFTTLGKDDYLWAYGTGGGSYTSCGGVGVTNDFTSKKVNFVFTMLFGSYFGDWDSQNNFLRAPLCSEPSALTCVWSARPHWFFHHMNLGYPIGYSTKLTQNNTSGLYKYSIYYNSQYPNGFSYSNSLLLVHVALMGDPTLAMYMGEIKSPTALNAQQPNASSPVQISWQAPNETGIAGYNVYRSLSPLGPFTKLNNTLVSTTSYNDDKPVEDTVYYMVRTVKLRQNTSGSFYNQSRGVIKSIISKNAAKPEAPELSYPDNGATNMRKDLSLKWLSALGADYYHVQLSSSQDFSTTTSDQNNVNALTFDVKNLNYNTKYYWRVSATNKNGEGNWSEVRNFTVTTKLESPDAEAPQDGSKGIQPPVALSWTKPSGAKSYIVQVANSTSFSKSSIVLDSACNLAYIQIPENLTAPNTTYYWRVKAVGDYDTTDWSKAFSFTTYDSEGSEEAENIFSIGNYPDPFDNFTIIEFALPTANYVSIEIFESSGKKIETLLNKFLDSGEHKIKFNSNSLQSGVYFYKLNIGQKSYTRKMIISK